MDTLPIIQSILGLLGALLPLAWRRTRPDRRARRRLAWQAARRGGYTAGVR